MEHKKYKELINELLFGEPDENDIQDLNEHLSDCSECREELSEMNRMKKLLDNSALPERDDKLLDEARFQLRGALRAERNRTGLFDKIKNTGINLFYFNYKLALSGVALILIGFLSGYFLFNNQTPPVNESVDQDMTELSLTQSDVKVQNIRFINQDAKTGEVEFVVEAVKPVTVKGNVKDEKIQNLLTYAMLNETNPGIRLNTINLMKSKSGVRDDEIKTALITVMKYDSIPGVRREAIKTLRTYSFDNEIKNALLYVLMNDENSSLRIEAINSLANAKKQGSTFNQEDLSIFREKMKADENNYVRYQAKNVVEEAN